MQMYGRWLQSKRDKIVGGKKICVERSRKNEKNYILRTENGTLVEVTREVYLEWYQSRRREKYQQEQKQKYGVCSLDVVQEGSFAKNFYIAGRTAGGDGSTQ